jgi:hypothetical protein
MGEKSTITIDTIDRDITNELKSEFPELKDIRSVNDCMDIYKTTDKFFLTILRKFERFNKIQIDEKELCRIRK